MTNAVIFDMDGVISNTQKLHSNVESSILHGYGIPLSPEAITKRYAGVPDHVMLREMSAEIGIPMPDTNDFDKKKWGRMLHPEPGDLDPMPGALEFIKLLRKKNIPLAVASGSSMPFIELVISTLGIRDCFETLVSSDEVENGKPSPDIFLLAAGRLGIEPSACVVIEDGLSGMIGAKAAGMECVALLSHLTAKECPTDICVNSLTDLDLKSIGL